MSRGEHARGAGAEGRQHPDQGAAAKARDITALRREMERRALPAGPPPAFQMNLLEAEGGLDQALARIEAARSQQRDGPALRLSDGRNTPADALEQTSPQSPDQPERDS